MRTIYKPKWSKAEIEFRPGIGQYEGVKAIHVLIVAAALAGFAGCKKAAEVPPPPAVASGGYLPDPTEAQPKLATMKLYVGPETLDAEMALTERQQQVGMMYRTNIQDGDAMIFPLPYVMQASFWMKHCPESISAAYITPDGTIAEIHHFEKNDETPVVSTNANILYVLETSEGWFDRHHVTPGMVVTTAVGPLVHTFVRK